MLNLKNLSGIVLLLISCLPHLCFGFAPLLNFTEKSQWRSVGRVTGELQCSGFLVDLEQGDFGPAYVLTNGHCVSDWGSRSNATAVVMDKSLSKSNFQVEFDFFYDAPRKQIFKIKSVVYSTMKIRDFAILQLDKSLSDVKKAGLVPLKLEGSPVNFGDQVRVVGAPLFSPDQNDFLRMDTCQILDQVDILEWFWFWKKSAATDCVGIHEGSSGSPMVSKNGRVFGIINTSTVHVKPSEVCFLGHPCEITNETSKFVPDRSYGSLIYGLEKCFIRGHFNILNQGCILDPGSRIVIKEASYTPSNGTENAFTKAEWNIQWQGLNQGFSYKVGLANQTDCFVTEGYSPMLPANSKVLEHLPLPQESGAYITCLIFEELLDVPAGAFPTIVPVVIDKFGPDEVPVISILNRNESGIWIDPLFSVPELAGYFFSVIGLNDDCSMAKYSPYWRIPISIEYEKLPIKFCLMTEDNAGNVGLAWEYTLEDLSQSEIRFEQLPSKSFVPSRDLLDQVRIIN